MDGAGTFAMTMGCVVCAILKVPNILDKSSSAVNNAIKGDYISSGLDVANIGLNVGYIYVVNEVNKGNTGAKTNTKSDAEKVNQNTSSVKIEVDERKFSEYALDPNNSNGKSDIFNSYGYNKSNSAELSKLYQTQAQQKYSSGQYTLGKLDQWGQRITIDVTIGNADKFTIIQTGWMINPDGSLRLVTPFAGFVK